MADPGGPGAPALAIAETPKSKIEKSWEWNDKRRLAAFMLASCIYDGKEISKKCGVAIATLMSWRENPVFAAEVLRLQRETGIAVKEERLRQLKEVGGLLGKKLMVRLADAETLESLPLKDHIRLHRENLEAIAKLTEAIDHAENPHAGAAIVNVVFELSGMSADQLKGFRARQVNALSAAEIPSGVYDPDPDDVIDCDGTEIEVEYDEDAE